MLLLKISRLLNADLSMFLTVFHVADENENDFWIALCLNIVKPRLQVIKRVDFRDIVGKKDAVRSFIKDLCDGLEVFLTSSVPNLEFKNLLLKTNEERTELNADCDFMVLSELVCGDPAH